MDPNYRASEDHWRLIENWPSLCSEYPHSRCILELRARIESLEAAQQPADQVRGATEMVAPATEKSSATAPPAPVGELVEWVAQALAEVNSLSSPDLWKSDACAVIRVIAAWMKKHNRVGSADLLEQEIK
jgi:hypothetical protein